MGSALREETDPSMVGGWLVGISFFYFFFFFQSGKREGAKESIKGDGDIYSFDGYEEEGGSVLFSLLFKMRE